MKQGEIVIPLAMELNQLLAKTSIFFTHPELHSSANFFCDFDEAFSRPFLIHQSNQIKKLKKANG